MPIHLGHRKLRHLLVRTDKLFIGIEDSRDISQKVVRAHACLGSRQNATLH